MFRLIVITRPIIEPCLRYIKKKCTFLGSQNLYSSKRMWRQERLILQGGSNLTGTDLCVNKPVTVPVIFEPPCIIISNQSRYRPGVAQRVPGC